MNFTKIGIQGHSLGSLHFNSEELVWTSADKTRCVLREKQQKLRWQSHMPYVNSPSRSLITSLTLVVLVINSFSTKKAKWTNVSHGTWAQFGDYCHLRLFMKNDVPPTRLDGFSKDQYTGKDSKARNKEQWRELDSACWEMRSSKKCLWKNRRDCTHNLREYLIWTPHKRIPAIPKSWRCICFLRGGTFSLRDRHPFIERSDKLRRRKLWWT